MKKILALLLVVMLLLCGCSGKPADKSDFELAESCIDKPIAELYELIGEPESLDYAPSCMGEGGEDGNLYYDGFIVYTYRQGDTETVYFVEKNQ